jgi:hypothetical protein
MSEAKDTKRGPDRAMVDRVNVALAKLDRVPGFAGSSGYSLSRPFGNDRSTSGETITGHRRPVLHAKRAKR